MGIVNIDLVQGAEERLVNVWPAVNTLMIDGWAVRLANGYSTRANSASALKPGSILTDRLLDTIEGLYRAQALTPRIRLTPLAVVDCAALLKQRGYHLLSQAVTLSRPLGREPFTSNGVRIADKPSPDWIAGLSALQTGEKSHPDHLVEIVNRILLPSAFASIGPDKAPIGYGLAVIDRGWVELGSLIVAPPYQGRGFGRGLVCGLLAWAQEAECAFLQVDEDNKTARYLYASLGFQPLYTYQSYIAPL